MNIVFRAIIPGRPIVKKNTQRTYGRGKSTRRVSTPRFRSWEQGAMAELAKGNSRPLIEVPVTAIYRFYFKDRQAEADVSNLCEAPGDLMEQAGVLKNDRLIRRVIAEKFFGHQPRTEIELIYWSEQSA